MRVWLVIGGIVAIGAGIVLWLLVRSDDDAAAQSVSPPAAPRERVNPGTAASDRPALPPSRNEPGSATPSHDYVAGDAVVRDHRVGDRVLRTAPPIDRQSRTRLLPTALTKDIGQKVRAVVESCAASIPADARTDQARLDGDITVAISAHTLTVKSASLALPGVSGPALDTAKQCIARGAVGLSTAAADQDDLENYKISVSVRLP